MSIGGSSSASRASNAPSPALSSTSLAGSDGRISPAVDSPSDSQWHQAKKSRQASQNVPSKPSQLGYYPPDDRPFLQLVKHITGGFIITRDGFPDDDKKRRVAIVSEAFDKAKKQCPHVKMTMTAGIKDMVRSISNTLVARY